MQWWCLLGRFERRLIIVEPSRDPSIWLQEREFSINV